MPIVWSPLVEEDKCYVVTDNDFVKNARANMHSAFGLPSKKEATKMNEEKQQTIEEWLDEKIAAYELLGKEFNPTGKDDYWECPRCINVHPSDREIHIDGFEKIFPLLKDPECALNRQVEVDNKVYFEQAFTYKGYKFFDWREMK